jgi:hypothetical protein
LDAKREMKEPSANEKVQWKLFNGFARLFGSLLILSCVASAILSIKCLIVAGNSCPYWLPFLFLPLIAVGVMMVRVKPFYPKEYREWFECQW